MFENSGFVICPCCGQLLEICNNGIIGWSAYLPVFNLQTQTQTNIVKDYMTNPTMNMRDQWKQAQNNTSNLNYSAGE